MNLTPSVQSIPLREPNLELLLKFELLCIDQENKVKFTKTSNFIKVLSTIESLWKGELSFSENPPEISDDIQKIKISIQPFDTSRMVTGERLSLAYSIIVEGEFDNIEPFRVNLLDHLKDLGFDHRRILLDEVSNHIAFEIYPLLNNIENLLRRYVVRFFIATIGSDWWSIAVSKDNRDKANSKKHNEVTFSKTSRVVTDVSLLNFDQLGKIIYSQSSIFTKTDDIFEKIKTATNLESLKQELLEGNYAKYFKDTFEQKDFQKKWEDLTFIRNKVAHNNYFVKEDIVLARALHDALRRILNDADNSIDTLTLSIADKEAVRKAVDDLVETEKEAKQIDHQEEKSVEELSENSNLETTVTESIIKSYLNTLSEEDLISQLKNCSKSRPFVGLKYFVREFLGNQGYSFKSSYTLINILQDKGKIEIYPVQNPYSEYNTSALKLVE